MMNTYFVSFAFKTDKPVNIGCTTLVSEPIHRANVEEKLKGWSERIARNVSLSIGQEVKKENVTIISFQPLPEPESNET